MSANGYDIQKYLRCEELAKDNNLVIEITGEKFKIFREERILGAFEDVNALFNFVTGYDWGNS